MRQMMKYIFSILIALLTLPVFAQKQAQAKLVLDKTADAFEAAGSVKADYSIQAFNKGNSLGTASGVIELKGDKFLLKTPETISWFDGKTQWSYLIANDEVNISTPTEAELQGMNPYALLYLYKKGFDYKFGTVTNFHDKPIYEILLVATDKKQDLSRIVLYVTKDLYQPVYIAVEQRDGSRSEITITGYQTGLKLDDSAFVFDKKQYPTAEVIDLR